MLPSSVAEDNDISDCAARYIGTEIFIDVLLGGIVAKLSGISTLDFTIANNSVISIKLKELP